MESRSQRSPIHAASPDEVTFVHLANVVLRSRRLLVLLPAMLFVLVVMVTLLQPRTYTSAASFQPQTGDVQPRGLAGLAAQFGFSLGASGGGTSPAFYASLIRSRTILEAAVQSQYTTSRENGPKGSLIELYGLEGDDEDLLLRAAVERLREAVSVDEDRETGMVSLAVRAPGPSLARQLATRILELVQGFNIELRQSEAAAERRFLESRLEEVRAELELREDSLEAFLRANRQFERSPELSFQHERLQSRVELQRRVLSALAEAYEQARMDEVRNTPVITIVDSPSEPVEPDPRRTLVKGLAAIALGLLIAVTVALWREYVRRGRLEDPAEFAHFDVLRRETVRDLRDLWARLRGE